MAPDSLVRTVTLDVTLPDLLVGALQLQAESEAIPLKVLLSRLIQSGAIAEGISVNGRCSLRTGLCSEGPLPLPLQQCD